MRSISLIQFKKRSLSLCWLLLGVYVWLSTVVQLNHTDDLRGMLIRVSIADNSSVGSSNAAEFASAPGCSKAAHAPATIAPAKHSAPDQPCLAHEWLAAVHKAGSPAISIDRSPVSYALVRAACFESAVLQRGSRTVTLRGPPAA